MLNKRHWEDFTTYSVNKLEARNETTCVSNTKDLLDLNGQWDFRYYYGSDIPYHNFIRDEKSPPWETITVPGCWQLSGYGKPYYLARSFPPAIGVEPDNLPSIDPDKNELCLYRRIFNLPKEWEDGRVILRFGAAKSALTLYVNSKEVGFSKGAMLPAEFDITDYLRAGENTIIAKHQFLIQGRSKEEDKVKTRLPLTVTDNCDQLIAENGSAKIIINKKTGFISSLSLNSKQILKSPIIPNYYRAMIDNDRGIANHDPQNLLRLIPGNKWKDVGASLKLESLTHEQSDYTFQAIANFSHVLFKDLVSLTYTLQEDGSIRIKHTATPLEEPYRIGLMAELLLQPKNFTWYGAGPHENYPDRKTGALIGKYCAELSQLSHSYMRPQENGNRCKLRWLEIDNLVRIEDTSGTTMNFSVHPYSQSDLDKATHIHTLNHSNTHLFLDTIQCGVGGDAPGFTFLKPDYIIHP